MTYHTSSYTSRNRETITEFTHENSLISEENEKRYDRIEQRIARSFDGIEWLQQERQSLY